MTPKIIYIFKNWTRPDRPLIFVKIVIRPDPTRPNPTRGTSIPGDNDLGCSVWRWFILEFYPGDVLSFKGSGASRSVSSGPSTCLACASGSSEIFSLLGLMYQKLFVSSVHLDCQRKQEGQNIWRNSFPTTNLCIYIYIYIYSKI